MIYYSIYQRSNVIGLTLIKDAASAGLDTVQFRTADSPANETTGSVKTVICPVLCATATKG